MMKKFLGVIIAIIFIGMLLGFVDDNSSLTTIQAPTSQISQQQNKQTEAQPNISKALSKEDCYELEGLLWNNDRQTFKDYSNQINKIYPKFASGCKDFPHQRAAWSPDNYWFLHFNYQQLAMEYFKEKNYEKAAFYFDKSIENYKKSSTTNVSAGYSYYQGGLAYYELGNWNKTEEYMLQAPEKLLLRNEVLAKIYAQNSEFKKSIAYYYKCLDFVEKTLYDNYEGKYLIPMDEDQLLYMQQKRFYYKESIKELSEYLDTHVNK